jgi:hypothetical protein
MTTTRPLPHFSAKKAKQIRGTAPALALDILCYYLRVHRRTNPSDFNSRRSRRRQLSEN